jgi:acetyl-CoA carboxylase carboxyl transferase subunit alpha
MAEKAAGAMNITAEKLKNFSLIDEIIGEPLGGAHRDVEGMADKLKLRLLKNLNNLNEFDNKSLVSMRQKKIEAYGEFTQV